MLQPGHIIDETYRVEKLLGTGGMANVYVVTHTRLPRRFALKVMQFDTTNRPLFLERFNREGEILARLQHPHIVDVIDRNQLPDGKPYLVMELLEGEDLATFVARTGALSVPVALRICSQIGEALEAAHNVGIVHRDLKPSNIFLSKEGMVLNFVKVLDFGIAKIMAPERTPMTGPSALMGTPAYMSPEQARGQVAKIDARTDQFALAAVLYEMLTGRGAFYEPGENVYAILERVIYQQPQPLKLPQINRAVMRALSKDPEERFASISEFLAAVGASTHTVYSLPSIPRETPGTLSSQISERAIHRPHRIARLGAAFGVGGAIAAGLLAIFTLRGTPLRKPPAPLKTAGKPAALSASVKPASSAPRPRVEGPPSLLAAIPDWRTTAGPRIAIPSARDTSNIPPLAGPLEPDRDAKTGELAPGSSPPQPSADVRKPPSKGPAVAPRRFYVGTKNEQLDAAISACAREHLTSLRLPEGTSIKLERSGTLAVVDAPQAVFDSGFGPCLRHSLSQLSYRSFPQSAILKVVK